MKNTRSVRILSIVMSFFIVIGVIAFNKETVLADTDATTGLTYTVSSGKATITGFTAPAGFSGSLVIPTTLGSATVTSISSGVFRDKANLTSITIPSGVIGLSESYFDGSVSLAAINVDSANANYKSTDGVLYSKDGTRLICCPVAKTGTFTIPGSVTTIGGYAFEYCINFSSITIPSNITSIYSYAFYGCTSLTSITVETANATYKSVDGIIYTKDGTTLICCPAGKSGSVTIPNGVTTIGYAGFASCSELTGITIPSGVTSIEGDAFDYCTNLSSIAIPSSVTNIGDYAFYSCYVLSNAYFYGNAPTLEDHVFDYCASDFTVRYLKGTTGYTNPWNGYTALPFYTADVYYQTHVQDVGWQGYVRNGEMSGTSAQSKRLEAIRMKMDLQGITGGIEYRTHVQDIGWQDWVANDALSGTSGQSKRLEAIQIRLTGEAADLYDVYYRVHAQNVGWMGWAKNGESSGTAGYSYRLEAIEVKLVLKGEAAPGDTAWRFIDKYEPVDAVQYKTHVQDVGWQPYVSNGAISGTSGESKRLEGIQIKLNNIAGGIEYRTHVQDYGWMDWASNDAMSGTSGQSKRLEAIQIRLTGAAADTYDIYYCVHAQNTGWLDWAKNGQSAGTAGFGYRLEAIQIVLVAKGGPAPGMTERAFVQG